MTAAVFIADARDMSRWLVRRESRGPGDTRMAMERIARRYGIPFYALWSLRYRPPTDLPVSVFSAIFDAYAVEHARQQKALADEIAATRPQTMVGRYLARAAAHVGGAEGAALKGSD